MDTHTKSQRIDESYREQELAPLAAIALLITDFVKVHGVSSLAKRPSGGNEKATENSQSFG